MKIKTIYRQLTNAEEFDRLVNEAIEQGWSLTKRELLLGGPLTAEDYRPCMLYAELVIDVPAPEVCSPAQLRGMAIAIGQTCRATMHCADCELEDICRACSPAVWKLPEGAET